MHAEGPPGNIILPAFVDSADEEPRDGFFNAVSAADAVVRVFRGTPGGARHEADAHGVPSVEVVHGFAHHGAVALRWLPEIYDCGGHRRIREHSVRAPLKIIEGYPVGARRGLRINFLSGIIQFGAGPRLERSVVRLERESYPAQVLRVLPGESAGGAFRAKVSAEIIRIRGVSRCAEKHRRGPEEIVAIIRVVVRAAAFGVMRRGNVRVGERPCESALRGPEAGFRKWGIAFTVNDVRLCERRCKIQ